MGDARPGALEPLSRAVIKSQGLRGSKNEVQMRGGFEARAEVPGGGGGEWGGAGRGARSPVSVESSVQRVKIDNAVKGAR